jgi:hypothetical protein
MSGTQEKTGRHFGRNDQWLLGPRSEWRGFVEGGDLFCGSLRVGGFGERLDLAWRWLVVVFCFAHQE